MMRAFPKTQVPLIIPGCRVWVDAADTSTITVVSGAASAIRNKARSDVTITQGTESRRPATGTRTHNGLNVLDFDGINDFMVFSTNDVVDEPFTVFVFFKIDSSVATSAILGRQSSSDAGSFVIRLLSTGAFFNNFVFGAAAASSVSNLVGNLNANIICATFQNGSGLSSALNNQAFTTGASVSGYNNNIALGVALGATNELGVNPMDGFIGECIIYSRVLTSGEIVSVNRYLSNKWGLSIS